MARVIEEGVSDIPVSEMKDGEVGVITKWVKDAQMIGLIIQRFENVLIPIGEHSDKGWDGITKLSECRVRILPKGTKIEL